MNKIDWKTKLTSRKFWVAVIGFITAILTAFNVNDLTIEQVVSVISASAVLIAYIIGEGIVDVARVNAEIYASENSAVDEIESNLIGFNIDNSNEGEEYEE